MRLKSHQASWAHDLAQWVLAAYDLDARVLKHGTDSLQDLFEDSCSELHFIEPQWLDAKFLGALMSPVDGRLLGMALWSKEDTLVFCWRGTEGLVEWLEDVKIKPKVVSSEHSDFSVESGFYEMYAKGGESSPRHQCMRFVESYKKCSRVVIVGHSLGAALANILALDVARWGKKVQVMTMGCPKMADVRFGECFQVEVDQSWQIVNPLDVVPKCPPDHLTSFLYGQAYHGLGERMELPFGQRFHGLKNHAIEAYVSALKAASEQTVEV